MRQTHGIDPVAEKKKELTSKMEDPLLPFDFTRDVERNSFECKECALVFSSKENRDKHEASHREYRPFKCSKCPATFKKHVARKMHERTCQSYTLHTPASYHGTGLSQDITDKL